MKKRHCRIKIDGDDPPVPEDRGELCARAAPDFLVDGRNEARWNPANLTEQASVGLKGGTDLRFTLEMMGRRGGVYRVTEYDRPRRFTHSTVIGNLPMRVKAHYIFEPMGQNTQLIWDFEVRPTGPEHRRGLITSQPGLYFVGLPFLTKLASAFIGGVGEDAKRLVEVIAAHLQTRADTTSLDVPGARAVARR